MKREQENGEESEKLKRRLKRVRQRKDARQGFGCDVAFKVRLVKAKGRCDDQS